MTQLYSSHTVVVEMTTNRLFDHGLQIVQILQVFSLIKDVVAQCPGVVASSIASVTSNTITLGPSIGPPSAVRVSSSYLTDDIVDRTFL